MGSQFRGKRGELMKAAPSVLFLPSHPCGALVLGKLRIRVEPRSPGNIRNRRIFLVAGPSDEGRFL